MEAIVFHNTKIEEFNNLVRELMFDSFNPSIFSVEMAGLEFYVAKFEIYPHNPTKFISVDINEKTELCFHSEYLERCKYHIVDNMIVEKEKEEHFEI